MRRKTIEKVEHVQSEKWHSKAGVLMVADPRRAAILISLPLIRVPRTPIALGRASHTSRFLPIPLEHASHTCTFRAEFE